MYSYSRMCINLRIFLHWTTEHSYKGTTLASRKCRGRANDNLCFGDSITGFTLNELLKPHTNSSNGSVWLLAGAPRNGGDPGAAG